MIILRLNRDIDGCGVVAPPVHSSRAPRLLRLANLLAHYLLALALLGLTQAGTASLRRLPVRPGSLFITAGLKSGFETPDLDRPGRQMH